MESLLKEGGLSDLLDADECVRTVEQFTDGNPREIKRALNAFRMSQEMEPEITAKGRQRLFALLVLQATDEDLYNEIARRLEFIPVKNEMYFEKTDLGLELDQEWEDAHRGDRENLNYLRKLYENDDFGLREDLFHSTMLESGHMQNADENVKIQNILKQYLEDKGFTENKCTTNNNVPYFNYEKDNKTIEIHETGTGDGHVNIYFNSLQDENRIKAILKPFADDRQIFRGTRIMNNHKCPCYYFKEEDVDKTPNGNEIPYIFVANRLGVVGLKFDRRDLLMIGDIVNEVLQQK